MKLPKGKVMAKFSGRSGVLFDALAQAPAGLSGYIRVVGPESSGKIGVILIERGEPIGCLIAGPKQFFGRPAVAPLLELAAEGGSQVRLIGFYEESLDEVTQATENMKRVAPITRADLEAARYPVARALARPDDRRPADGKAAQEALESVRAPGPTSAQSPSGGRDAQFFRELLETGIKAAREESKASGEPFEPDLADKLEDYLTNSNLQLDEAIATFATVITKKQPEAALAAPEERALPAELRKEIKSAEEHLAKTAQRYEYLLTKDMASAKALRDQEENLVKMEGQLRDLKANVQGQGEKRLKELEQASSRASGRESMEILGKLKEEQEAIYARVEKLVQMEALFKQNLLTQRKRIEQKEQELQQLASQLKSDFLERKRLLDEEKESYLEELRRQSKELKAREAVAVEREKKASALVAKLEGEIELKIREIEGRRLELEEKDRVLRGKGEALQQRAEELDKKGAAREGSAQSLRLVEKQRADLAREREEFAGRIGILSKREEELRALEARLNDRRSTMDREAKERMLASIDDDEMKRLVQYLDRLLESLPADKVSEFAASDYYHMYIKLLEKLGI